MDGVGFYKYIVENKNSYSIMKNNEKFGTYLRLSDALYERDQLIRANWNWDRLSELPERENIYEDMDLPPFTHEYSYIYELPQAYKVCKDNECFGQFKSKNTALDYAKQINGGIIGVNKIYVIQKRIDGKQKHFGSFKTFEEAKNRRDYLIENGWKHG